MMVDTFIFNYSKVIIILLILIALAFMATVIGLAVNRPVSCPKLEDDKFGNLLILA